MHSAHSPTALRKLLQACTSIWYGWSGPGWLMA
jgi:hypothetical protein